MRTIAGLTVEGVDPGNCNFDVDETTLPYIMNCFRKGRIALDYMQILLWKDIQRHIPEQIDADIHGSRKFLTWLKGYDLSKHKVNRLRNIIWGVHHLYRNGRITAPSIKRKLRCYYYIALARLKPL